MNTIETAGVLNDGRKILRITLNNANGMKAVFLNIGCTLESLWVPDRYGTLGNVALKWPCLEDYMDNGACIGGMVGRTAGRTEGAVLTVDDRDYLLTQNYKSHSIHGGIPGLHRVVWRVEAVEQSVVFSYCSPHGEGGYPGSADLRVVFTLSDDNKLIQEIWGEVSEKTWLNLTNHTYFNLSAGLEQTIHNHKLNVPSADYAPVKSDGVVLGYWESVKETPFDLSESPLLESILLKSHPQLNLRGGIDHAYRLNEGDPIRLSHQPSGRILKVETEEPAVVVYTGNFLHEAQSVDGTNPFAIHQGLCLETQQVPDAVRHGDFKCIWSEPQRPYHSKTIFAFSTE